jgi:hypothetical protein
MRNAYTDTYGNTDDTDTDEYSDGNPDTGIRL